jgi:hypothetical protein
MKLQKRQYSSDDLARSRRVVKQIERVWRHGMIRECNRQIAAQPFSQKAVERVVETRHLVVTGPRDKQRDITPKIFH